MPDLPPVPAPPGDLARRDLPLRDWPARDPLWRIHRAGQDPIFWSPGPGRPPSGRFDSAAGRFGVLYAAADFPIAFAETLLRNPQRLLVPAADIAARAACRLHATALRLVDLTGPGLSQLGLDARLATGAYAPCGLWADSLWAHPAKPHGLLYRSRFDPAGTCLALFEGRAHLAPEGAPRPLADMAAEVGAALDRYGKALDPG